MSLSMKPAILLDDVADLGEVAIEQIHHVVGRKPLRQRREIDDVAEEDRNMLCFAASRRGRTAKLAGDHHVGFVQHQASDAKLAFRPELTGQPDLIRQSQPVRHQGFVGISVRASLQAIENPNAACRAFRPAAACVGKWHARSESRLEQGLIGGHVKIDLVR